MKFILSIFLGINFINISFSQGLTPISHEKSLSIRYIKEFTMQFEVYPDTILEQSINNGLTEVDFSNPESVFVAGFTDNWDFLGTVYPDKDWHKDFIPHFEDYTTVKLLYKFSYEDEHVPIVIIGGKLSNKNKPSQKEKMLVYILNFFDGQWKIIRTHGLDQIEMDTLTKLIKGEKGSNEILNQVIDDTRCSTHNVLHLSKVFHSSILKKISN